MDKFGLSFIVPVFNTSDFVIETIDSIILLGLDFQEFEIIIVDDFSSDNSASIVKDYLNYLNASLKSKVVELSFNHGVTGAKNIGVSHASFSHLVFIDSDDVIHCSGFYSFFSFLQKNRDSADVFFLRCIDYDDKKLIGKKGSIFSELSIKDVVINKWYGECLPVIKKNQFKYISFSRDLRGCESSFYLSVIINKGVVLVTPFVGRLYRRSRTGSITNYNFVLDSKRRSKCFFNLARLAIVNNFSAGVYLYLKFICYFVLSKIFILK